MKPSVLLMLILIGISSVPLIAQEEGAQAVDERLAAREAEFERLLDESLDEAQKGNWTLALAFLAEAETYYPEDPRISEYRTSYQELAALDDAQSSWNEGNPAEVVVENDDNDNPEGNDDDPKFTIDRGDKDPRESPILTRDNLRSELALKIFSVDPFDSYARNGWTSVEEFFMTGLGADLYWWFPFMGKNLGLNFRSSGYAYRPGQPDIILNSLDLGLNIRGFLLESKTSRLEIGLDFGGAFQSTIYVDSGTDTDWALFLGLWLSDPLFYHVFQADNFENLIFGGGLRIYSSFSDEIFEMINYRVDGSWVFLGGHVGVRLEWWDYVYAESRETMMSLSVIGGYRF